MKDKVLSLSSSVETIVSCGVCHQNTIDQRWCAKCIDIPELMYTANPIQTEVYRLIQSHPNASFAVASRTGTGKTICAWMKARQYLDTHPTSKVLIINPLKQIVKEKVDELRQLFPTKALLELTGDTSDDVGFGKKRNVAMKSADIIVTSQEMFDSLTRKPDIYTAINEVGLIVIDEIHGIGDGQRGAKLDGAVTRFLLRMKRFNKVPQIVALSATFANIEELRNYFEQYVDGFYIITNDFSPIKANVDEEVRWFYKSNIDLMTDLVANYKDKPGGILCMQLSIPGSKKLAEKLNDTFGPDFARTHFSELSRSDRDANVEAFNNGEIKVLCTTPTLLAGVNVSATVIILNVTFFNPLTMEMDVLAPTAIRQAAGRVGRPPKFNEGWVTFIGQAGMEKKVQFALHAPNTVLGAMNSALELILNVEISLQSQNVETLRDWYAHSFSGYSEHDLATASAKFDVAIAYLTQYGYVENANGILSSTKKGASVAKNFVNPVFMETCIAQLNTEHTIDSTESMMGYISELLSSPSSPRPFTQGMQKNMQSLFNFSWMYKYGTANWDWALANPNVQWASAITFTLSRVQQVAEDLEYANMVQKLAIINYSLSNAVVPYPLVQLGLRLAQIGAQNPGPKYLLYLHCNDVKIDLEKILSGPTTFRTPIAGNFSMPGDRFQNVVYGELASRFRFVAANLVKYYGKAPIIQKVEQDEMPDNEPDNPWDV